MSGPAEILFLAHRLPYPPDRGDKIRAWNFLSHLTARHPVHLGCFVDDPRDFEHLDAMRERCAGAYFARLNRRTAGLRCVGGVLRGVPLTVPYYRDRGLQAWVDEVLRRAAPKTAFVYSSAMAQYVMDADAGPARPVRRVMDFVDVDSDKWRQLATMSPWPRSWVYRREAQKLLAFERRVAGLFDSSLFVSGQEAGLFRRLAPECNGKVHHVLNGVNHEFFSPELRFDNPFPARRNVLVFTGVMNYQPNVDAVVWFARRVLPRLRQSGLDPRFVIVGRDPQPEVRSLEDLPGVEVTGRVDDVRPYLAHADIVVAPLRVARGIQNKVLEAMAMAKPVVVTPQALEGIEAAGDREVAVAEDESFFADHVLRLIGSEEGAAMGRRARQRVIADYSWAPSLRRLDSIVDGLVP
jgi:sugar transferase (PEP-CTERM/EpsH1 system associated)